VLHNLQIVKRSNQPNFLFEYCNFKFSTFAYMNCVDGKNVNGLNLRGM